MARELKGEANGQGLKIAVVVSRFNEAVTRKLLDGALEGLRSCKTDEGDITVAWVPGSLELGLTAKTLAESRKYAAIVCLGAVIKGETSHYDIVATQGTAALARVALETGVPIAMGVLTTESVEQAMDRAGGKVGNKGHDAALAALEMANLMRLIKEL